MTQLPKGIFNIPPATAERAAEEARKRREERERDSRLNSAAYRLAATLGRRFSRCTFENYFFSDNPKQVDAVNALLGLDLPDHIREGRGVLLYGPTGTGKDHLVAALLKRVVSAGFTAEKIEGLELYRHFKTGFANDRPEREVIAELVRPDVLAISDPTGNVTESTVWQRQTLHAVIAARYNDLRSTWLTINAQSRQQAIEMLTPPTFRRLADKSLAIFTSWEPWK